MTSTYISPDDWIGDRKTGNEIGNQSTGRSVADPYKRQLKMVASAQSVQMSIGRGQGHALRIIDVATRSAVFGHAMRRQVYVLTHTHTRTRERTGNGDLLLLLLLLLTRRFTWRLVQKLQGHVTQKNADVIAWTETQTGEHRSAPSVQQSKQVCL